jgi:putative addiction module component (TIGR02574 family)
MRIDPGAEHVLTHPTLPITPEQQTELDRRLDAYEKDHNQERSAEAVIADIRARLQTERPNKQP